AGARLCIGSIMNTVGASGQEHLRVSIATYNRILFPHPQSGVPILALERRATVLNGGKIRVRAHPFGGAVRILDPAPLEEIVGELHYDSERSKGEQDFRILIPPSKWDVVKHYCLQHLGNPEDAVLEALPHRELAEEFAETLHVDLRLNQYSAQPLGFVIEDSPAPTANTNARGMPTVRLYRVFDVRIVDQGLHHTMLAASEQCPDRELARLAQEDAERGGKGRANSILALPLEEVTEAYLALPPDLRFGKIVVVDHELDESVLAVLGDVDVPQYQRM
ncbi:MAG TPA: hypothetical protein VFY25_11270, partial [Anaerolineales bacterium]|nr:hypothetical protein [Anaerolineales bacterium]